MESLCLTSKILLSDHNVKIHQYEYGRCFRMKIREDCVNLSDVMFGLSDYLCSFIAEHSASNVRPGQTQLKNRAGVNTAISIVYNQSKIKLFR